jgi:cytochrome c553
MNKLTLSLALLLSFAPAAFAGDAAAGKDKSISCSACHAADGNSLAPTFPKLAGQNEKYLLKQLNDIKSGARPVPTMAGQLDNMSDEDMADIAAWYASQTITGGQADPDKIALGEKIYRGGNSARGVAACVACHLPRGNGLAPAGFPALAGQHAEYLADQLRRFRSGAENTLEEDPNARTNDGDNRIMRDIASRMSDKEIDSVSSYITGLY